MSTETQTTGLDGYDGFWECKADPTHDTRIYTICDTCKELNERKRRLNVRTCTSCGGPMPTDDNCPHCGFA